ncbi:hypothetical protein L3Q82_020396, partial [Scortum barcoo]
KNPAFLSPQDHSRTDRHRNQRCNYVGTSEPEYDVVDDQEEVLNVRILPARPINDDTEYAGPAINRDLKPGRRKARFDKRFTPAQPGDQALYTNAVIYTGVNESPGCNEFKGTMEERTEYTPHNKGLAELFSAPHTNQRHSLDLETHDFEKRSQLHLERVPSKRHHHEWPQTKEDFDQHDFVPMEKPQQTNYEEDWYVGACNRADAEHALHLVNKDGAFLVRDCSVNTNSEPLVLAVYHEKKVYNVKIRFLESMGKYALGTGQRSNDMFDSVADIIKFHSIFPIILVSGRNMAGSRYPDNCVLTCPVTKSDVYQLLQ